jgi:hypothetical protein
MKAIIVMCMVTLALAIGSCSSGNYRYACISLESGLGKVLAEGKGNPSVCEALFKPPAIYMGLSIDIPQSASIYGVLVVTNGSKIAAIPLRKWTTETGEVSFGCNGPSPKFAHQGKTVEEFVASIKKYVGK